MTDSKALETVEKKELKTREEMTTPGRYYVPYTDIYETEKALVVVMEMPGVEKNDLDIKLDKDVLTVEGRINFSKYENMKPLYTEYNVGHYRRSFTLSSEIDQEGISAGMTDGVLTLELPKAEEARPRRIEVTG